MKLTSYQVKVCKNLLKEQGPALPLKALIYKKLPKWSFVMASGFGSSFIWFYLEIYSLAYGMAGFVIGAILSDLALLVRSNRLTPIMTKVIDYQKLENLIESKEI